MVRAISVSLFALSLTVPFSVPLNTRRNACYSWWKYAKWCALCLMQFSVQKQSWKRLGLKKLTIQLLKKKHSFGIAKHQWEEKLSSPSWGKQQQQKIVSLRKEVFGGKNSVCGKSRSQWCFFVVVGAFSPFASHGWTQLFLPVFVFLFQCWAQYFTGEGKRKFE